MFCCHSQIGIGKRSHMTQYHMWEMREYLLGYFLLPTTSSPTRSSSMTGRPCFIMLYLSSMAILHVPAPPSGVT